MNVTTSDAHRAYASSPYQDTSANHGRGAIPPDTRAFVAGGPSVISRDDVQGVPNDWRSQKPTNEDASLLSKTMRFVKTAYERVKTARANLYKALSDAGKNVMNKLFGAKNGKLSADQVQQIDGKFAAIEDKLKRMIDNKGADIRFFGSPDLGLPSKSAAGVAVYNGDSAGQPEIGIARSRVKFGSNDGLLQTIIHEASHSAAGTNDYWYLTNARDGLGRDMEVSTFVEDYFPAGTEVTFDYRADNADTIAMAALRLGEAKAIDEKAPGSTRQTPEPTPPPTTTPPTQEPSPVPPSNSTPQTQQPNPPSNGIRQTEKSSPVPPSSRTNAATEQAISKLEKVKTKLHGPWDKQTVRSMHDLFGKQGRRGPDGFSAKDIAAIEQRIDAMIGALKDVQNGNRKPQLRRDESKYDDDGLAAEIMRDAVVATGGKNSWTIDEMDGHLVNRYPDTDPDADEDIEPENIDFGDALQNGSTLLYMIATLSH